MIKLVRAVALVAVLWAPATYADWHSGRVTTFKVAYDGQTVTFNIAGYSRTNCTCYASWNTDLCLDRSRASFREEVAMLLSARARGTDVHVNINETTCSVTAIYEAE